MNRLIKTACYQIISIAFFAMIYNIFSDHFNYDDPSQIDKRLDYLLLSTTIQCSIGVSGLNPTSDLGKIILILHQLTVLFIHIITIYILKF
jgi:hypothetical protein